MRIISRHTFKTGHTVKFYKDGKEYHALVFHPNLGDYIHAVTLDKERARGYHEAHMKREAHYEKCCIEAGVIAND